MGNDTVAGHSNVQTIANDKLQTSAAALKPVLHLDVLIVILSHSPCSVLSAFMQTCRYLCHEGVKELLRRSLADIHNEARLSVFCSFLKAPDSLPRLPRLRALRLTILKISSETAELLLACVPEMQGLQELALEYAESVFSKVPALGSAFAALEGIVDLELGEMGIAAYAMLKSTRSALRRVQLRRAHLLAHEHLPVDPVELLAHQASSLEELSCTIWTTHTHADAPHTKFKKLRRFEADLIIRPSLAWYHASFPNLETLSLRIMNHFYQGDYDRDAEALRERNFGAIEQRAHTYGSGIWPCLQEFTGEDIVDAYATGLTCRVDTLRLRTASHLHWLPTVLSDTLPRRLSIALPSCTTLKGACTIDPRFVEAFRAPSSLAYLRSLYLSWICNDDPSADLPFVFKDLLDAMTALSVETLDVQVRFIRRVDKVCVETTSIWERHIKNEGSRIARWNNLKIQASRFNYSALRRVQSLREVAVHVVNNIAPGEPPETIRATRSDVGLYCYNSILNVSGLLAGKIGKR